MNATGGVNALLSNGEWWKNGTTLYVKTSNGAAPSSTGTGTNTIESKRRHFAFSSSTTRSGYTIKGFNLFACSITTDLNAYLQETSLNYRIITEAANNILIDGIVAKYVSHQTNCSGDWQSQHYAWSGIVLSGRNNILRNSNIQYSAKSAISVSGADNKVLNNIIYDTNYMCSNAGSLNTAYVCLDAEIANNTIYNTTSIGINFKYGKNSSLTVKNKFRIHHNTIYDFMRRSGDSGAINKAVESGDWLRIDHNTIYTTKPVIGDMVHGIYLDYGGGANIDLGYFTLDHNVIYNLPAPLLINNIKDINIYNNVLLTNSTVYLIEGAALGTNFNIKNNILSKVLNIRPDNLIQATISNNIYDVKGLKVNSVFANAPAGNFSLIATATSAINTGVSVGIYDDSVVGLPDLGAYEYVANNDGTPPSTPTALNSSNIGISSFTLSWNASTDNTNTVYYEVYRNGAYLESCSTNSLVINGLVPGVSYNLTVRAKDAAGNSAGMSTSINVQTLSATNLATAGVGYRWSNNSNSTNNTNRVTEAGMNDGNLTNSISLNGGIDDTGWAWEAGGVLFTNLQNNISSVNFIQGDIINGNSCFTNWLTMQYTLDGTTWNESNWRVAPEYTYGNIETAGKTYVFNGSSLSGVKGVRISGIVHTNDSSWVAYIKEVRAYAAASQDVTPPTTPSSLSSNTITSSSFTLNWVASTDNVGVTSYEIFRGGVSVGTSASTSFNVTGLSASTSYSMTVRALDAAGNASVQSAPLSVTTSVSTATNIATSGTGYYWSNIPVGNSTSNTTRVTSIGINNGNLVTDVLLPDVTAAGNWQAFGITWSSNQSIGSIKFYNGQQLNDGWDNGSFTANLKVQSSTNGSTWTDVSGWTISPAYPYNTTASNQVYILSGPVLTGRRGIRVIGQLRTTDISWSAKTKELQVYATTGGATMYKEATSTLSAQGIEADEISVYPNPASNQFSVNTKGKSAKITVLSLDGRVMSRVNGKDTVSINSGAWSSGIYLIQVETEKEVITKKLVVLK